VQPDLPARKEFKELLVLEELLGCLVLRVIKDRLGSLGQQVLKGQQVHSEGPQVLRAHKDRLVSLELPVHKDRLVSLDRQARKVRRVQQVPKDPQVQQVPKVILARKVPLVSQVLRELRAFKVLRVPLGQLDQSDRLVRKVPQVFKV
jgi:hypothetical protein